MRTQPSILIYGTQTCGDCIRSKRWLSDHGYAYEYVDISGNADLAEEVIAHNERLGLGPLRRIPVILIEGHAGLSEPTDDELREALDSVSHPESDQG